MKAKKKFKVWKKKFEAWVLDNYAAMMVRFFPELCVKKFIKKSNKNAEKFLPGTKEFSIIEKLSFNDDELRARVWSLRTRIMLIAKRRYALISDIQTDEEFEWIFLGGHTDMIIEALKVYTPSKQELRWFILQGKITSLFVVMRECPEVFSGFEKKEILKILVKRQLNIMWRIGLCW